MSIQAYQRVNQQAEPPRQTEYRAFADATRALIAANENRAQIALTVEAIHKNRRLWSILSDDCAAPGNKLPDGLRAGIISLAIFVDRHSSQVIRENADIDVLIDINRTIMQGLAGEGRADSAEA
jgi:flagellar protein FlaF